MNFILFSLLCVLSAAYSLQGNWVINSIPNQLSSFVTFADTNYNDNALALNLRISQCPSLSLLAFIYQSFMEIKTSTNTSCLAPSTATNSLLNVLNKAILYFEINGDQLSMINFDGTSSISFERYLTPKNKSPSINDIAYTTTNSSDNETKVIVHNNILQTIQSLNRIPGVQVTHNTFNDTDINVSGNYYPKYITQISLPNNTISPIRYIFTVYNLFVRGTCSNYKFNYTANQYTKVFRVDVDTGRRTTISNDCDPAADNQYINPLGKAVSYRVSQTRSSSTLELFKQDGVKIMQLQTIVPTQHI